VSNCHEIRPHHGLSRCAITEATTKNDKSRVSRAYSEIKRRILNNEWPAGHRAFEPELSAEFGMSRTPIREALVRLEAEGLVRVVPRRGMCVIPMSPTDVLQVYEVLAALESMAAELLARQTPSSTKIKQMVSSVTSMRKAVAKKDFDAWASADEQFHDALLMLSGNPRLEAMGHMVRDQAHRARMTTLRFREARRFSDSVLEHQAIIEAIQRGEVHHARERARKHRLGGLGDIMDVLKSYRFARF